ncbi:MAG: motility associated factor glycosyltransferase family protein [Gammaproteobacteria bacterium]|nr:motility associated factor glycosyltransferase family protein [Gammaproteobacteria bacterium]
MLKNIKHHIDDDEAIQSALESELAHTLQLRLKENIQAFQRNIPSLLPFVRTSMSQNISIFCNKNGQPNIVDYGLGRVLYGFDPQQEVSDQVNHFLAHSPRVELDADVLADIPARASSIDVDGYQRLMSYPPLPDTADVVVVLGIGLGEHIKQLLAARTIKNLVIYEPEPQYFSCSTMIGHWKDIFNLANQKGTALFIQLEKDGRDLVDDMDELRAHVDFDGFYVYQHYNSPIFNSIACDLRERPWPEIKRKGLNIQTTYKRQSFEPLWLDSVALEGAELARNSEQRFAKNLAAFKHYFPDIYNEFKDYTPDTWLTVKVSDDDYNLLNHKSLHTWYGDSARQESDAAYNAYATHPNRDGLVLGYNGTKLRHYLHYKFVLESETLLHSISERNGALPDTIKSLIMFGLGAGYQLQALLEQHQVEKLFLCEPNKDFFYASLYAIDWHDILHKVDDAGYRIYINIGDDGTHLFRDLLNQFYAIGPYNLAQTYFYQVYYNAELNGAIAQLREQLQVVISMGEYFDHAYYGINHTVEGLCRNYPHLRNNPQRFLAASQQECPVFIVGNGPSLDYSIEVIKEYREQAIVVSCGTALQVLHRHNIVPDFHAEIEQNRSTFDWAVRLGDFDYLKQITLLSCNGIHPDTCELYANTLICFKDGESSTVSNLNILGKDNFSILKFAFPTVSNFTLNLFTTLGFQQLYLFGVDLGFIDKTHHHSKLSGYYDEKGEPLYDYEEKNNTGLIVPGNFRSSVSTKHEFKVSKMFIEDLLRTYKGDCYNTSDGAKIIGTQPLPIDNVLILSSPQNKQAALAVMHQKAFAEVGHNDYLVRFNERYQHARMKQELAVMTDKISAVIDGEQDVMWLIEYLKTELFKSYSQGRSLLFYYLYGTLNFANAFLLKVTASDSSEEAQRDALAILLRRFKQFSAKINADFYSFDITSSFGGLREREYLRKLENPPVITLTRHYGGTEQQVVLNYVNWWELDPREQPVADPTQHLVYADNTDYLDSLPTRSGQYQGILALVNDNLDWSPPLINGLSYSKTVPLPDFDADEQAICAGHLPVLNLEMYEVLMKKCYLLTEHTQWFIPRYSFVSGGRDVALLWLQEIVEKLPAWDRFIVFPGYLAIPKDPQHPVLVDRLGSRGEWVQERLNAEHLLGDTLTQKEFFNLKRLFHKA